MIGTFEYRMQPASLCIGISHKGMAAIKVHNDYTDKLEARYSTDNPSPLSYEESPPARYRKIA
jgi:hypothetical protein